MPQQFDRSAEDLGNAIHFEHVNIQVPDQRLATLFYVTGLGLTRDPYLMVSDTNMWINAGRSQFHLPSGRPQVLRGHTGLVIEGREALLARLASVAKKLEGTAFTFAEHNDHVEAVCPWGNRITVHALEGVIGFFRRDSHRLIDIERCPISRDEVNGALGELRDQKHVRDGHYTLRAGSKPRVFSQVNDEVAQSLQDLIIDLVPPNQELLIDAYCGAGFFAKALLDKFERVIGIDWDRFAIAAAKENAVEKETYIAGDVEGELTRSDPEGFRGRGDPRWLGSRRSLTIIVDPPATGLTEGVRKAITDLAPETLIYVSCNPPTLARDLKELQHRFAIDSITPLDMFPQTAEIEVLAHLEARR